MAAAYSVALGRLVRTVARSVGWLSAYLVISDALGAPWWPGRPGARLTAVLVAALAYALIDELGRAAARLWHRRSLGGSA